MENITTSSGPPVPAEQGVAYFHNATAFHGQLPGGLTVCRESRRIILPQYMLFDLGAGSVERRRADGELIWDVSTVASDPVDLAVTQVLFNPDYDNVVLHLAGVLFSRGLLQATIPRQLCRTPMTRPEQKSLHVKHLATTCFPWNENNGTPNSSGDMVEAFPGLSDLYVIGLPDQKACGCGHCPSLSVDTKSLKKVKNQVIETLKRTLQQKGTNQKMPDVYTFPMNDPGYFVENDPALPWYAFMRPKEVFGDDQGLYIPPL